MARRSLLLQAWARFKQDVWTEPVIRPVTAALLTALAAAIVGLTLNYAHLAASRTGAISPEAGRWTILGVLIVTGIAAVEPWAGRMIGDGIQKSLTPRLLRLPTWARYGSQAVGGIIFLAALHLASTLNLPVFLALLLIAIAKPASVAWSLVDVILARLVAWIAGSTQTASWPRYRIFLAWMLLGLGVAIAAVWQVVPPFVGLAGAAWSFLLILGVVRRWSWFEADRDTYLVERGDRRRDATGAGPTKTEHVGQAGAAISCIVLLVAVCIYLSSWLPLAFSAPPAILVGAVLLAVAVQSIACAMSHGGSWVSPVQSALRVRFKEDLRDEALVALGLLIAFIPLTLDLIYQMSCMTGFCAFEPASPKNPGDPVAPIPQGEVERLWLWLGFFGAELAKTVPFVDWSEVFHVANSAPIQPTEVIGAPALGAQTVFVMRAGLDLLLLGTVLQAISIASRLRDQSAAFKARQLPILEPFAEARELSRVGAAFFKELDIRPSDQQAIAEFPPYEERQLQKLIAGKSEMPTRLQKSRLLVRRAAVALLARQYRGAATDMFLFDRAQAETNDPDMRGWIERVASGVASDPASDVASDRPRLHELLGDPAIDPHVRAAAARRLGRLAPEQATIERLLIALSKAGEDRLGLGADAAGALAKLAPTRTDVLKETRALVARINQATERATSPPVGEPLMLSLTAACALARLGITDIAAEFNPRVREHVLRAASIQLVPMDAASARANTGAGNDQTVRIEPGTDPFPETFLMGSREDGESDPAVRKLIGAEFPQVSVRMDGPFAIGRFPVLHREYVGFSDAMGRKRLSKSDRLDNPAVEVDWHMAGEYADWLERITGDRWRLPSEAEWEYACRAAAATAFWWGDTWDPAYGNLQDQEIARTSAADHYAPNPWGLSDMYGNVYEWCADQWHPNHHGRPEGSGVWFAVTQGGLPERRVVRGGSWSFPPPKRVRSAAYRNEQISTYIGTQYGFRLVREIVS